jgi:hypothetical protein
MLRFADTATVCPGAPLVAPVYVIEVEFANVTVFV